MEVLDSRLDPQDSQFQANAVHNRALAQELRGRLALARSGGGPQAQQRHAEQGKLFVRQRIDTLLARSGITRPLASVDYPSLYAGASPLDDEIFTWMISVPGLSFDVLERTRPIVAWLRGVRGNALQQRMVANTLTGIVHFHEIPGEGTLDLGASFKALTDNGFSGYGSVELYHHVASWQKALDDSYRHLAPLVAAH